MALGCRNIVLQQVGIHSLKGAVEATGGRNRLLVDEAWPDRHIGWMRRGVKAIRLHRMRSSSIEAAGYDLKRRTLRIRFVRGSTYDYQAVPPKVFRDLLAAESKGRFVNWSVKPYYRHTQVK